MFRRISVGDNERILIARFRRFDSILGPGRYWVWTTGTEIGRFNVKEAFVSPWADYIVTREPEAAARFFVIVETSDTQVAPVYIDGKLTRVIPPAKRVLFWRGSAEVTFEVIDILVEREVPARLTAPLQKLGRESLAVFTLIDEGKRGLVYVDGRLFRELEAGTYAFWSAITAPRIEVLEMRRQTLEVAGQEILTKDKVTVRVNISALFEIVNVAAARSGVADVRDLLYRTLQVAVRQSLGRRTLEEVLAEKTNIDEAVSAEVASEMAVYGVRVASIALKDIILPGDIRDILNQVVTAEKQAQANLIRRREETAATRSLLNTAKLMEDNPILIRLKELETLEKVADKVDKITVVGGLNALLDKTVTIRGE